MAYTLVCFLGSFSTKNEQQTFTGRNVACQKFCRSNDSTNWCPSVTHAGLFLSLSCPRTVPLPLLPQDSKPSGLLLSYVSSGLIVRPLLRSPPQHSSGLIHFSTHWPADICMSYITIRILKTKPMLRESGQHPRTQTFIAETKWTCTCALDRAQTGIGGRSRSYHELDTATLFTH